jgi:sRNA-binding protein
MTENKSPDAGAGAGNTGDDQPLVSSLLALKSKSSAHAAIPAVLDLLAECWPNVFPKYERRRRPLKIGIHLDVLAALAGAVTATELAAALSVFTGNMIYQKKCTKVGAPRIDLDSKPAGVVTEEQSQFAKMRVSEIQNEDAPWRRSKPQRARLIQLRNVEVERRGRLVIERKRRLTDRIGRSEKVLGSD